MSSRSGRPERSDRERQETQEDRKDPVRLKVCDLAPTDSSNIPKSGYIEIIDLRPLFRGFDLKCIITERLSIRKTSSGQEVCNFTVADKTAACTLVVWENGSLLKVGDVLRITNGEVRLYNGKLELTPAKNVGKVRRYDQYLFKFVETEHPNLSHLDWVEGRKDIKDFIAVTGPNMEPFFPPSNPTQTPPQPRQPPPAPPQRQSSISLHQSGNESRPRPPPRQPSFRSRDRDYRSDRSYERNRDRDFDRNAAREFEPPAFVHRDLDKPEDDNPVSLNTFGASSNNGRNNGPNRKRARMG